MEKKSIILLIISSIILIIAIVFAVWSLNFDSSTVNNQKLDNVQQKEENNDEELPNVDMDVREDLTNVREEKIFQTTDFEATYKDFSIVDEVGNIIKLSDYQNSPVMVLFVNLENEDSIEMLKRVNEQYSFYKEKVKFIVIQTKRDTQEVLQNIELPIYQDKNEEIIKMYNVENYPTMLYINKENEIFNSKTGLTSVDALIANLDILSENY